MFLLTCLVVLSSLLSTQASTGPKIAFKYQEDYEIIWDSRGSDSHRWVSIWHPLEIEKGFYLLGDTVVTGYEKPLRATLTVSALQNVEVSGHSYSPLTKPADSNRIWNDRGSKADRAVTIFELVPEDGYTCLGHIAISRYGEPDLDTYRCVKTELVVNTGSYELIWRDNGSGAKDDVSLFGNINIGGLNGRDANTFTAVESHGSPKGSPYLLDDAQAVIKNTVSNIDNTKELVVYQVYNTEQIWTDAGSGAERDFSTQRAREITELGLFSLGDIAIDSHDKVGYSILVRALKDDALAAPVSFRRRWDDGGSGAEKDVAFFDPICPRGYRALGQVSVSAHHTLPHRDDIRCVKLEYTSSGKWRSIWNDKDSGARKDVSVYMAVPNSRDAGQGVRAMSSRPCHCLMERDAYVLDDRYIQYIITEPISYYDMTNVHYDAKGFDYQEGDQIRLDYSPVFAVNNEPISNPIAQRIRSMFTNTHTWSQSRGLQLGVTLSVSAGIPMVSNMQLSVTSTSTRTQTTGETVTETITIETTATQNIPPRSRAELSVFATRYTADVHYNATVVPHYRDGSIGDAFDYSGVYRGILVNNRYVVFGESRPI